MKLLMLHKTSETFTNWTLRNTLAEVLLCIGMVMELAVSCRLRGTCYQHLFVSTVEVYCVGVVVAIDIVVM
jgi:hypothetical protein